MRFIKMQAAGNDYVYVDAFVEPPPGEAVLPALARAISDRHTGVGSDGLIVIRPVSAGAAAATATGDAAEFDATGAVARMQMFNADGSEAQMCGNGLRCVAKYVYESGLVTTPEFTIATAAGPRRAQVFPDAAGAVALVRLDMGAPRLENAAIPIAGPPTARSIARPLDLPGTSVTLTAVSMGNPHAVIFVEGGEDELAALDLKRLAAPLETHAAFAERTNVEVVAMRTRRALVQRTWERGAGETLACGTGACAALVAAVLTDRAEREATVHLRGGALELAWDAESNHVFLTGPAVEVFRGDWPGDWPADR